MPSTTSSLRLAADAQERQVEHDVDALLRPWGGGTAHGRSDQPAARVLEDEFAQLRTNATVFPFFFLVVAAFLLNVVLSRLVASQRDEIAALKAFGYTNARDRPALSRIRRAGGRLRRRGRHSRGAMDGRQVHKPLSHLLPLSHAAVDGRLDCGGDRRRHQRRLRACSGRSAVCAGS